MRWATTHRLGKVSPSTPVSPYGALFPGEINSGDAASTLSSSPVKTQQLLWVSTAPGVTAVNLATFYFAALITVSAYTYVNIAQRLVLGESFLAIPEDEMGSKTGTVLLLFFGAWAC